MSSTPPTYSHTTKLGNRKRVRGFPLDKGLACATVYTEGILYSLLSVGSKARKTVLVNKATASKFIKYFSSALKSSGKVQSHQEGGILRAIGIKYMFIWQVLSLTFSTSKGAFFVR